MQYLLVMNPGWSQSFLKLSKSHNIDINKLDDPVSYSGTARPVSNNLFHNPGAGQMGTKRKDIRHLTILTQANMTGSHLKSLSEVMGRCSTPVSTPQRSHSDRGKLVAGIQTQPVRFSNLCDPSLLWSRHERQHEIANLMHLSESPLLSSSRVGTGDWIVMCRYFPQIQTVSLRKGLFKNQERQLTRSRK